MPIDEPRCEICGNVRMYRDPKDSMYYRCPVCGCGEVVKELPTKPTKKTNWYEEDFKVGDTVEFTAYWERQHEWRTVRGPVVRILLAGYRLTQSELNVYFNLRPHDRHYAALSRPATIDRLVVAKDNGKFVIVPVTPKLRGTLTKIGGSNG